MLLSPALSNEQSQPTSIAADEKTVQRRRTARREIVSPDPAAAISLWVSQVVPSSPCPPTTSALPPFIMSSTSIRHGLKSILTKRPDDIVVRSLELPRNATAAHLSLPTFFQFITSLRTPIGRFKGGFKDMYPVRTSGNVGSGAS